MRKDNKLIPIEIHNTLYFLSVKEAKEIIAALKLGVVIYAK